ncbi:hypothetical protein V7S43_018802 [Phytophthora oleae]|uniref:DDE Tnp4 domain-containing protein n=1 Tax=Phytophthora oleae TaxID=2107226 RepID=A0ABD3EPN8_9STRA
MKKVLADAGYSGPELRYAYDTNVTRDLVVDVVARHIVKEVELDAKTDGQIPILDQDYWDGDSICKADPDALAKRGITDLDMVRGEQFSAGVCGYEGEQDVHRVPGDLRINIPALATLYCCVETSSFATSPPNAKPTGIGLQSLEPHASARTPVSMDQQCVEEAALLSAVISELDTVVALYCQPLARVRGTRRRRTCLTFTHHNRKYML